MLYFVVVSVVFIVSAADLWRVSSRAIQTANGISILPAIGGWDTEAADSIRDNKLKEKVRYTNSMLRGGQTNNELEGDISSGIDALRNKLGQAQGAMGQGKKNDRMANNLDRARNLVRGVDSMQQQMRNGQQGENGMEARGRGFGRRGGRRTAVGTGGFHHTVTSRSRSTLKRSLTRLRTRSMRRSTSR